MIYCALYLSILVPVIHLVICNIFPSSEKKIFFMFISFFSYFFIFLIIIKSLNLINSNLINLDFFSALSLILFFCLGYMEFFSMLFRGFSLRILTDIYKYKGTNKKNIIYRYSDNKGIDWLFKKRLRSIEKLNLVNIRENKIYIKFPKGTLLAYITFFFNKLFLIKNSGE